MDAILDSLTEAMADGEEVGFTGFGKFLSQRRRARMSWRPGGHGGALGDRESGRPWT